MRQLYVRNAKISTLLTVLLVLLCQANITAFRSQAPPKSRIPFVVSFTFMPTNRVKIEDSSDIISLIWSVDLLLQ